MQIANPIYDVVFKFMMEDNKVAKIFLGAILGQNIEELEFMPQETSLSSDKVEETPKTYQTLTLMRMDFRAKIKDENGETKLIIIELQKSKYYLEVMRFRRYLGKQYIDSKNKIEEIIKIQDKKFVKVQGIPIFPIYILGEKITNEVVPVLKVGRNYIDISNQSILNFKHDFIEGLSHDSIFIQIPHLKGRRKTDLEQLLYIFDQSNISETQNHFLEIDENDYPEKYKIVIRRLKMAMSSKEIIKVMESEDELQDNVRILELEIALNKETIEEKNKKIEDKDKKIKQEKLKNKEKDKKIEEKDKKIELEKNKNIKIIQSLSISGMSIEEISRITGLTIDEIKSILQ